MTTGVLVLNVVLAFALTALVGGVAFLVPSRLDRRPATGPRVAPVPAAAGGRRWVVAEHGRAEAA